MQIRSGRPKVNAWGESHLWARKRKESSLSGLIEPIISVSLDRGVSIICVMVYLLSNKKPPLVLKKLKLRLFFQHFNLGKLNQFSDL